MQSGLHSGSFLRVTGAGPGSVDRRISGILNSVDPDWPAEASLRQAKGVCTLSEVSGVHFPSHRHCQILMDFVQTGQSFLPALGRAQTFDKGDVVYPYGAATNALYVVKEGRIRTSTLSEDGRELVTGMYGPGDVFGQFCLCQDHRRNEEATAIQDARVTQLGVEDLIELASTRTGALGMLQLFCQRISALEEQVSQLAFANVRTRLALLLLRLAEEGVPQADGGHRVDDSPTHEEMANRIGTTREQVTAALAQFRRDGLVAYRRSGPLTVYPRRVQTHLHDA